MSTTIEVNKRLVSAMFVIPATGSAKLISKTCCKNSRAGSHTRRLISTNFAAIAPVRYIREVADFLEFQQDLLLHVFAIAVQQLFLGGKVNVSLGYNLGLFMVEWNKLLWKPSPSPIY